jgi:hypothetical protein
MKKQLLTLVFWLVALLSFSQEGIKYTVKLERIYESEYDTLVYVEGIEQTITILEYYVLTESDSNLFVEEIVWYKKIPTGGEYYTLVDSEGNSVWLSILQDHIKIVFEIDPKMVNWYKILSYEKVY